MVLNEAAVRSMRLFGGDSGVSTRWEREGWWYLEVGVPIQWKTTSCKIDTIVNANKSFYNSGFDYCLWILNRYIRPMFPLSTMYYIFCLKILWKIQVASSSNGIIDEMRKFENEQWGNFSKSRLSYWWDVEQFRRLLVFFN